ncbi:hypothetical protein [Herbaspirillum autotrophicum]|uniref:hypothetical protein n=1 Tax=Herbaspirillum autotrophicum TaxID=180195 RepID=UPI00067D8E61|nr:hypothetical protein [Herbaspirillum autotrophicum]
MYTRNAFFLGRPVAGTEDKFIAGLEVGTAAYAKLPGVRSARLEFPLEIDAGGPEIFATIRMVFDSSEDIAQALASPQRQAVRATFAENVMPMFEGKVVHVNSRGIDFE